MSPSGTIYSRPRIDLPNLQEVHFSSKSLVDPIHRCKETGLVALPLLIPSIRTLTLDFEGDFFGINDEFEDLMKTLAQFDLSKSKLNRVVVLPSSLEGMEDSIDNELCMIDRPLAAYESFQYPWDRLERISDYFSGIGKINIGFSPPVLSRVQFDFYIGIACDRKRSNLEQ